MTGTCHLHRSRQKGRPVDRQTGYARPIDAGTLGSRAGGPLARCANARRLLGRHGVHCTVRRPRRSDAADMRPEIDLSLISRATETARSAASQSAGSANGTW
jgi:hypothetical protein